jgi:hypothetical protein
MDYNWDLSPGRILLDEELNVKQLGWNEGDYFKVETVAGRTILKKVDPIEVFAKGYKVNSNE